MGKRDDEWTPVTDARPGLADSQRVRRRRYLVLMGICVTLIVLAWNVVRLWSTTAAVIMSIIAMVIPPIAAFVANSGNQGG